MSYTLQTVPTCLGNQSHIVSTTDSNFANALYEQALDMTIEPDFTEDAGVYSVEFLVDIADCHAAIQLAMAQRGNA